MQAVVRKPRRLLQARERSPPDVRVGREPHVRQERGNQCVQLAQEQILACDVTLRVNVITEQTTANSTRR